VHRDGDDLRPLEHGEDSQDLDFAGDFQMLVWPFLAPPSLADVPIDQPSKGENSSAASYSSESEESETDTEDEENSASNTDFSVTDDESDQTT
jgi:hypothetical protein